MFHVDNQKTGLLRPIALIFKLDLKGYMEELCTNFQNIWSGNKKVVFFFVNQFKENQQKTGGNENPINFI